LSVELYEAESKSAICKIDPRLRGYRDEHHLHRTWATTLNQGPKILYLQPRVAVDGSQPADQ
jgi:hypothetical protein